jgi:hydrophobe/amphiphile efflux-1 (HAE1) family protein
LEYEYTVNLIDLSIRRNVFAWILMSAFIIFGAICFSRLGISQLPDVDFPVLTISVNYDGAAPEVVEAELIDPIEERLLVIEGVKEMKSSVMQGSGRVTLEFDIRRNVDVALQEVQSALSQLRLPVGIDPPVIRKSNPEEDPIIFMAIYSDQPIRDMLIWVDTYLLDQFRFLPGVGEVSIGGFSQRNLRIWIDPKKLETHYLTVADVLHAVQSQHLETAAGQYDEGKRELRVRWLGEAASVKQVEDIRIIQRGGQVIHKSNLTIKDVATVDDGLSDIQRVARVNGKEAVSIAIRKQRGTNEVEVAAAIRKKLEEIKPLFPKGYESQINIDFTRPTSATVALTTEKLWVAAGITIFVCFLFLGNLQAALNILFSIPTSIVGTFIILYFCGFTLNLFTLLALTLAISIVVDDAIMLLENIVRHYRMGKGSVRAAAEGAKEVLPAATAATLAVVAVFLPVVFMSGTTGKFFFQFGIAMSAAVLLSLVEAVTITPMRAAAFLNKEPKISRFEKWLDHLFERVAHLYRRMLDRTLSWSGLVVVASLLLFSVSLLLIRNVRQEFVPSQDQDVVLLTLQTPPGTSLPETVRTAEEVEILVREIPYIRSHFVSVGAGGPNTQANQISMPIQLVPKNERQVGHLAIMNLIREKLKNVKGLRVTMRDISARNLSTGRLNPVAFNLRGPDLSVLETKATEVIEQMEKEHLVIDMDTDFRKGIPELLIVPNRKAMADRGVSIDAVSEALAVAIGGLRQGKYTAGGRRYDIRFKIPEEHVRSEKDIQHLYVRNVYGNLIPLAELVSFEKRGTIQAISRTNRQRAISVFGNLAEGQSQAFVLARARGIAREILPSGYIFALEGAAAGFAESFRSLYVALLIGLLVAYMILAVQFNSFVHPVAVLVALPFSVSGALLALWLFDTSLNLFSFIGLIVLMGIAKKNSILLVEFTNHVRSKKPVAVKEALLEACPIRLRPIVMTSFATIAAALPLMIGSGLGHETRLPMGLTIAGGTLVSTLLTLFVVPSLYLLLTRTKNATLSQ